MSMAAPSRSYLPGHTAERHSNCPELRRTRFLQTAGFVTTKPVLDSSSLTASVADREPRPHGGRSTYRTVRDTLADLTTMMQCRSTASGPDRDRQVRVFKIRVIGDRPAGRGFEQEGLRTIIRSPRRRALLNRNVNTRGHLRPKCKLLTLIALVLKTVIPPQIYRY